MHLNLYLALGAAVVGLLVGLTGAGGGALMTPMLILLFNVTPTAAISSDLVASVVMRPIGAAVHTRAGTVNWRMAGWLCLGSVPTAFLGAYLLHLFGDGASATKAVETVLGAALLVGVAGMAVRFILDRRHPESRDEYARDVAVKPLPTFLVGLVGGLIVGMTSVGSGSLIVVSLLFIYPTLAANQLVGTDLSQAVPLTLAAAAGQLIWGHVDFAVTTSLLIGAVPAVLVGSLCSSRVSDRFIRPIIAFVIFASGLKYAGLGTTALGWVLGVTLVAGLAAWFALNRPPRRVSSWLRRTSSPSPI